MFERLRFYTRHSVNDLRVNGRRTVFALLCIAAGVAAIVSLQTLAVMMNNTLTGSLQETNRGDIRINPGGQWGSYIVSPEEDMFDGSYSSRREATRTSRSGWIPTIPARITYRQAVKGSAWPLAPAFPPATPTRRLSQFHHRRPEVPAVRHGQSGKWQTIV